MEEKTQAYEYAVSFGDPFDGITLYGPFKDADDAGNWAAKNDNGEDWHVVRIYEPI